INQKYVDAVKVQFIIREFPFDPRAAAAFMLARSSASNPEQLSTPEQYFPMVSMLVKNFVKLSSVNPASFDICSSAARPSSAAAQICCCLKSM
ncbi:thioredoxin domain-containing protein, partial [Rhizobium ruizarguesonis]